MLSDIEIAQLATPKRIIPLAAEKLGIPDEVLEPYGHYKAKVDWAYLDQLADNPNSKLILVTAISPTPAGEGKTTTSVGLGDGLSRIGKKTMICLREPSLGPVFGMKGGAAGGGYAQVIPMEDINLHFTGDFSAIALANNLLAALVDNHIHQGNTLGIDVRRVRWRRALDVNDRNLRAVVTGLGGTANGTPIETGFDITVASEVMAILCLANDLADLKARLAKDPQDDEAVYQLAIQQLARQQYDAALDALLKLFIRNRSYNEGLPHKTLLQVFELLGNDHPLVSTYRRKLFAALY